MKCPRCKNKATKWELSFYNGICAQCYISRPEAIKPLQGMGARSRKTELNAFAKDVLQPRKGDGTINKDFVQAHGTKSIEKEYKMTKQEVLKNVEKYG